MTRSEILDTAKTYVTKDRNATHGEPEDSFARIAQYWSMYLGRAITSVDVGILMTLFKLARAEANPTHLDSWVDACGYAACTGELCSKPS